VTNHAANAPWCAADDNLSLPACRVALFAPATLIDLVVHGVNQHLNFLLSALVWAVFCSFCTVGLPAAATRSASSDAWSA
jgi:hypothetical protein